MAYIIKYCCCSGVAMGTRVMGDLPMEITNDDFDVLIKTVWGEARGEPAKGIIAVTWVILNRYHDSRWPDGVLDVCMQSKQFSVWNDRDINRVKMMRTNVNSSKMLEVTSLVSGVLAGMYADPTGGANHYHHKNINPSWANPNKITAQIGNHRFYKL